MTSRDSDPFAEVPKRKKLVLFAAGIAGGIGLLFALACLWESYPSKARFEITAMGNSAVARLDKVTGEIVVFTINGREIARFR